MPWQNAIDCDEQEMLDDHEDTQNQRGEELLMFLKQITPKIMSLINNISRVPGEIKYYYPDKEFRARGLMRMM